MTLVRINPEYQPKGNYLSAIHFLPMRVWQGSTSENTYVDIPVDNLSNSYRRQGIWLFITPNSGGHGTLAYLGISDSGEVFKIATVYDSNPSALSLSASVNKTNNTVRVNVGKNWSHVFAFSPNRDLRV